MLLSVVIPAHNEADGITATVTDLHETLAQAGIEHEIVVVNDHSSDRTAAVVTGLSERIAEVRMVENQASGGFGMAVRCGLENFRGDAVAIYMADASDSPEDLVMFVRTMEVRGTDCVFGSRFAPGGRVVDYPRLKLFINRVANTGIRALFGLRYDDMTNAFKLYRREVIEGVSPLLSHHFNLTVEIPLKAVVRGYSFAVVPNSWTNRAHGTSKFQIQEMGSRYAFIVLYCFLERWLSRGDYHRRRGEPAAGRVTTASREDT
jgi:dolichol-phosphate mannosyltransferase